MRRRVGGDPVGADLGVQGGSHDVGATALVQTVTVAEETPEFLVPAESHDLIAGVVGWGGPHRPDMADDLARLRALPGGRHLKGIRHPAGAGCCGRSGGGRRPGPTRAPSAARSARPPSPRPAPRRQRPCPASW